tara:strand:- start:509 stop:697 length:189 start_codon:yes stop_codon:yes gene_type:complete
MAKECKKCKVVHSALAEKCFSCGESFKGFNVTKLSLGMPTLLATTFLSLSVVILNINLLIGT